MTRNEITRTLRRTVLTLMLSAVSMLASAQQGISSNQRLLGYIITDSITAKGGAFGSAGTYTVGAALTSAQLKSYAGCRVVGVRLAVACNLGRTRTFVYNISGTMTAVAEQKQKLYEGWNNVFFNGDGYLLTGEENLFFGFDYVESEEMVAAEVGGLCGFGEDTDGGFYYYYTAGAKPGLYQISGIGRLCVQLIIDVSSMPLHDVDLTWLDTGFKYKVPGETIEGMVNFASVGREDIASYRLGYQFDEQEPVYQLFPDSLKNGQVGEWKFITAVPKDMPIGMHTFRVFVSDLEGNPLPEKSKSDTLSADFAVYRQMLDRTQAYMEVYTDQNSTYVPYLEKAIARLQANPGFAPYFTLVNVHRPGTPLAVPEAAYLHERYAYTWPSFTVNRAYFPGEAYIAYDMNDYLPVLDADMNASIISALIEQDFYSPSFATVSLQADYDDATRELTVKATGTLLPEAEAIYGDVALTLMLTENNVVSNQMQFNSLTQKTSNNKNYVHNQVLRTYLTSPIGDGLTADNDAFEFVGTKVLDEAWNPKNMQVVALLTKKVDAVTDQNLLDVDVINCNSLSLAEVTGIQGVKSMSPAGATNVFTLDGRRVTEQQMKRGIYVVNGRKMVVK